MSEAWDLVVRGGLVVDGTGEPAFEADVAIQGGTIAEIGRGLGRGREEIDARGRIVTPGFVDIHTHYDGQATWEQRMQPSSWHGVTTVVMGNCGIGFAPCRPADRDRLIRLMEGVEDIPFPVLAEGLPWNWETFGDYLDGLDGRPFDVDIGAQLPHSALRVFVMGQRGADREVATAEDIDAMAALTREAMEAGALGFSTSRTLIHRTSDGEPIPTLTAGEPELAAIAAAMGEAGRGVMQFISDFEDPREEVAMFARLCAQSGRPLSFALLQTPMGGDRWRGILDDTRARAKAGTPIKIQVCPRAIGVLFGLDLSRNPFSAHPSYRRIEDLPLAERLPRLRDPEFRAWLLAEAPESIDMFSTHAYRAWTSMSLMGETPDYEPAPEQSIAALAAAQGRKPEEVALDHMLSDGGRGMIYMAGANYLDGSLDAAHAMLTHPEALPALSDAGAHLGLICDGGMPSFMLTHWTRDRTRGPRLRLEDAVRLQSAETAAAVGLLDRGRLKRGLRADLNVIDYDRLRLHAPELRHDLPAGGKRLVQRASGYAATVVAGQVTYRDGEAMGPLPGRLIRGAKPAPAAA